MEVTNCTDINGNEIANINLNPDGSVLGVLVLDGIDTNVNLSYECCTSNGYLFDPNDTKCYWSTSCDTDSTYKIILSPEDGGGALFQVDEDSIASCILEVEFDYIIKFKCENITTSLKETIEGLKLQLSIEKVIYNENLPIPDNLVSVISEDILNVTDLGQFLSGNTNTGLLLDNIGCDALIQNLITDLGPTDSQYLTETSLNSTWVRHKMVIDDATLLQTIVNEKLKVVIIGNNLSKFSILIDNIKLNRVCTEQIEHITVIDDCPNFNLKRVIDNKKSWVGNDVLETRNFDLSRRLTNYSIIDDRLGINTKEVDLLINPTSAIENDMFNFIITNPCILQPVSGCTSGDTSIECIDIESLLTTPLGEISNNTQLLNELIDVKSRKTISAYPTIELVHYRYINSLDYCGIQSNALNYDSVTTFVDLIGGFWSDLIEQVVPATTIWGSSYQHTNDIFGVDKFKYKKSTLLLCETLNVTAPSPSNAINNNVGVIIVDITDTGYFGPIEFAPPSVTQYCSGVSIVQISDSSEFIGKISIVGGTTGGGGDTGGGGTGGGTTSGATITINETISDNCNIYNSGDFDPNDYNNNDWDTPNNPNCN